MHTHSRGALPLCLLALFLSPVLGDTPFIDADQWGTLDSEIEVFGTPDGTVCVRIDGRTVWRAAEASVERLWIRGGQGDDWLTVDHRGGLRVPILFDGGAGGYDGMSVRGERSTSATYRPHPTTYGAGTIAFTGEDAPGAITFTGLEPIDLSGLATATLQPTGADDVITIAADFDFATGTQPALRATGTSGGVAFEAVAFSNNTTVVIDTTTSDGDDSITITGAANDHGNTHLLIDAGTGTDLIDVQGAAFFAGSIDLRAAALTVGAGLTSSGGEAITLRTDQQAITAAINSATGIVTLEPLSADLEIALGSASDQAGILDIADAELDLISATILRVGSTTSGDMTLVDRIDPALTNTLSVLCGGRIIDDLSATNFAVRALAMQAADGVAWSGNNVLVETECDTIAVVNTTSGGIAVLEVLAGGDLVVGTVDGVVGVQNLATSGPFPNINQVETNGGNLTVDAPIFSENRSLFIVAQAPGNGTRTLTNNSTISTTDGDVELHANNMALENGTITAGNGGDIILRPEFQSALSLGGVDVANVLGISAAELATLTLTGTLELGHGATTGLELVATLDLSSSPTAARVELRADVISGSGANVLTAADLSLRSDAGIGSMADAFRFDATTLTTLSVGDQFLVEADTATITSADLDAGTSSIVLGGGTFVGASGADILSAAVVESGATLVGTGTVGDLTVESGGGLAPGSSPGTLTSGSLDLQSGATLTAEVDGDTPGSEHDQLSVTGTVSLGGSLSLSGTADYASAAGGVVLIDNDGSDAVTGTFAGLAEGASVSFGALQGLITYVGGTGNDVELLFPHTAVTASADTLVVVDDFGHDDQLTITVDTANSRFVINDPGLALATDISGATQPDANTLHVPFGSLVAVRCELRAGDDQLTLDFSGGLSPVPFDILGGAHTTTGDRLAIEGGSAAGLSHLASGPGAGRITVGSVGIDYTGLE